jgi:NTP pyrophosphatase (non-canonical NTP hydrolase)
MIGDWQRRVHALATAKGWWDDFARDAGGRAVMTTRDVLASLALIHSEVSEALEDVRVGHMLTWEQGGSGGKPVGFPSELADVVIRCMDLAEALGIDLEAEIRLKHAFNETRPVKHGGKLA